MTQKNKTILIIIILVLTLSVILYFAPVKKLIGRLPYINQFYNNTTLEISLKKGVAKIWVDGKDYGETPTTVENLPEGTYLVELQRIAKENTFYKKHSFQVELTRNTSARIDLEIGPEDLLHGAILYYTPIRTSSNEGFLTVLSNVDQSRIFVDEEFLKTTPLTNLSLRENQYNVRVLASGHETVEIPVLVRNNYSINLKTFHFPIPVLLESLDEEEALIQEDGEEEKGESLEIENE